MEENSSISSSEASSDRSNQPDPAAITDQVWEIAEEAAWREVISCIHPTLDSEEKRKDVIDFVQRTIRRALKVEVFPYGSVPLKTYLPDGDIDLTALNIPKTDDSLSRDVLSVMHAEQLNANAEYEVRDTQFIDAEVKLVKCLVQNIVIDISFNQLGGLSTLCFLEQVDRLIAKDHLFKHSIILIKAWCFYESRILGAHHGLISTYALESLVLYIFNMFNSSLTGPLAVLYRFLVYYSKFDWENYCISLNGPVLISYLPDLVVANPENDDDLMLSEEFLRNCVDMFSVTSKSPDTNLRTFPKKNLNIIDPLKPNNNLGRSVNRGNYFRIRSAFKFGARKLGNILMLPRDRIVDEIKNFFENTLERHRHKNASNISGDELGRLPLSAYSNDDMQLNHSSRNIDDHMLGMEDKIRPASRNELESYSINTMYSQMVQTCYTTEETGFAEDCFGKEYNDSTYRSLHLQDTNGEPDFSSPRRDYSDSYMLKFHAGGSNNSVISGPDDTLSDCLSLDFKEKSIDSIAEDIDSLCLSDLSGDYDSHVRSLLYGQCCHGTALSAPAKCNPPPSSPSFHVNNKPWDTVRQYLPLIWKTNSYGAAFGHQPYPVDMSNPSTASFGLVERRKARGTGTYIPNPERNSVRDRPSQARKIKGQETGCHVQKNISNSGADSSLPRTNAIKEDEHKLVKEHSLVSDCQKQDLPRQPAHAKSIHSQGNGIPVSNRKLEFGSFKSKTEGSSSLGSNNSPRGASASSSAAPKVQNSKEGKSRRQARVAEKSLNLNNDDDFPPLSS